MRSSAESRTDGSAAPAVAEGPDRFSTLLSDLGRRLSLDLGRWLRRRHAAIRTEAGDATAELTDRLEDLVQRGGKRLRPALVYYAYHGSGGALDGQVLPAAMAAEVLHAYLLVHDDIMDRAETRRGAPAAHLAFRDHHRQAGWPGEADLHGQAAAILLGDLAHGYAVELFLATEPRPSDWSEVVAASTAMCSEVVIGQYLEMTAPFRGESSEEELLRILRLKSGRYTVERPIEIGARLAGVPPPALEALARFGREVGEAFQLKDDLLGVFGERDAVGKPVGGDLKEGKHTVLIHHTLAAASGGERRRVEAVLGNPVATSTQVDEACRVIEAVGARARVETMVEERIATARRVIDELELTGDGRDFFIGLLRFLKERRT